MSRDDIKSLINLLEILLQNIDEKYINDDFYDSTGILFKTLRKMESEMKNE